MNKKTKNIFYKQNEVIDDDFEHKFKIREYLVFVLKLIIIYEMSYNFFQSTKIVIISYDLFYFRKMNALSF